MIRITQKRLRQIIKEVTEGTPGGNDTRKLYNVLKTIEEQLDVARKTCQGNPELEAVASYLDEINAQVVDVIDVMSASWTEDRNW